MMSAVMASASVTTAAVTALVVLVIVMIALDIRIVSKIACEQSFNCCIARSTDTAVKRAACLCKSHLRTASDATANKNICSDCFYETG